MLASVNSGVFVGSVVCTLFAVWIKRLLAAVPVVQMHGMGDYANDKRGMVPIRDLIAKTLNTYVVNVPLADNDSDDSAATFFKTMDQQVDIFKTYVQSDKKLTNGFNAVGWSQGNLIIRGYVEKYNQPPVLNWISFHGPLAGVAGIPKCSHGSEICQWLDKLAGSLAYSSWIQGFLAQSNYLRDPLRIPEYLSGCTFLPEVNNENTVNPSLKQNFATLKSLVLVKALQDTVVLPKDSEWFQFFEDGSMTTILGFNQTQWYQKDLFGLKTLSDAGRIQFLTTPGDHMQVPPDTIADWVTKYFGETIEVVE